MSLADDRPWPTSGEGSGTAGPSLWAWLLASRQPNALARAPRDARVDLVRGFALLAIFVTHVPGNPLADVAPGAFFFHDAADAFVLMAGFAVALAFGPVFEERGWLIGTARVMARALQLYFAHILIFVFVAALIAWAAVAFDDPLYFEAVNILPLFAQTESALLHALTLTFQPNFLDILPLYIVLLAGFPLLVAMVRLAPGAALLVSLALWLVVQATGVNLPNVPLNGSWFFNPFAWQLIFVIGAVAGYAARDGVALPRSPLATVIAAGLLLFIVLLKALMGHVPLLPWLDLMPEEWRFGWDKASLSAWRTAGLLATAYLIAVWASREASWLSAGWARTLAMVGRQSLPVFCVGIALSIAAHVALMESGRPFWAVAGVNLAGLGALVGLAAALDWYEAAAKKPKPQARPVERSVS